MDKKPPRMRHHHQGAAKENEAAHVAELALQQLAKEEPGSVLSAVQRSASLGTPTFGRQWILGRAKLVFFFFPGAFSSHPRSKVGSISSHHVPRGADMR